MRPTSPVVLSPYLPAWRTRDQPPVLERYEVDEATNCWEWRGLRMKDGGYGRCKVNNLAVQAHRVFYEHHVGPIPPGHDLHHRCGNRGCVNPEHLTPLTRGENTRQKPHGHTLLTWEQADEIRETMDALCAKYGVRPRTLSAIAERQIWKPEAKEGR